MVDKVAELSGIRLDYWVAKANGMEPHYFTPPNGHAGDAYVWVYKENYPFEPSFEWGLFGPILEREKIQLGYHRAADTWQAWLEEPAERSADGMPHCFCVSGSTPLEAACRAFVMSRFGEEVPRDQSR